MSDTALFIDVSEEFIEAYALKNRQTSVNAIQSRAKARLLPAFKAVRLGNISKRDLQAVIVSAYKNGAKSPKTIKELTTTIRTFCKWAATRGYMTDAKVPFTSIYLSAQKRKRRRSCNLISSLCSFVQLRTMQIGICQCGVS